jgi:hypothetical protein
MQIAGHGVYVDGPAAVQRVRDDDGCEADEQHVEQKKIPVAGRSVTITEVLADTSAMSPTTAAIRNRRRLTRRSNAAMRVSHCSSTVVMRAQSSGGPAAITM